MASGIISGGQYGLVSGISLAAAEIFWIGLISHKPPLCFLLYMFFGDIALLAVIGALLGAALGFKRSEGVSSPLLALVLIFVYISNSIYRSSLPGLDESVTRRVVAFVALLVVCLWGGRYFHRHRTLLVRQPWDFSHVLSTLFIAVGVVGGLIINKAFLPDLLTPVSLLGNFVFGIVFGPAILFSYRIIKRKEKEKRRGGLVLVSIALAVAVLTGFASPLKAFDARPEVQQRDIPPKGDAPSVILVVIDTLRADHVSAYGYHRETTPHIDALAKDSVLYEHVVSPAPWTLPSHASLFTGLLPDVHGADFVDYRSKGISRDTTDRVTYGVPALPLSEDAVTLAETLAKQGYVCGAIVANFAYLWRGFQLDQGFDSYDDARGVFIPMHPVFDMRRSRFLLDRYRYRLLNYADATSVTDRAIRWLRTNSGSSFFLFLNYMDTHTPYAPPPEYRKLFPDEADATPLKRDVEEAVIEGKQHLPKGMHEYMVDSYDAELRYADAEIGRLLTWLKEKHLYESCVIVVASDHGESLGDHDFLYHMNCLYEHELHVPFLIKYPDSQRAGETVGGTVSLAEGPDIILNALHMPPLASPPRPIAELYSNRDRIAEYGSRFDRNLKAVYQNGQKVIFSSTGEVEVYDLRKDPQEAVNLAKTEGVTVQNLLQEIGGWDSKRQKSQRFKPSPAEKKAVERLRSLGYLK